MSTLTARDGTRIFYSVRGKGRPPFIFIHGWCSNLRDWEPQARHFSRHHRVLSVDRRGHGRSAVPDDGYDARQHADDVAAVARKERIRGAVVVGHALGCPTTLELARRHPNLARAVVLVDGAIYPRMKLGDASDPAGSRIGRLIESLNGPSAEESFRAGYAAYFSPQADPEVVRRVVDEAARTPLAVATAELRAMAPGTQGSARAVRQPVLMINADPPGGTSTNSTAVEAVIKNVQFGRVVGSGHFPQLEVPEQLNPMIERFVAQL